MRDAKGSAVNQAKTLTGDPIAHLTEEGRPHLLIDHLKEVAALAARFAKVFGAAEWGLKPPR